MVPLTNSFAAAVVPIYILYPVTIPVGAFHVKGVVEFTMVPPFKGTIPVAQFGAAVVCKLKNKASEITDSTLKKRGYNLFIIFSDKSLKIGYVFLNDIHMYRFLQKNVLTYS